MTRFADLRIFLETFLNCPLFNFSKVDEGLSTIKHVFDC